MAAGSALVHPIRQFLFAAMPAFRAVLAGCFTPGIQLNPCACSFFRFQAQPGKSKPRSGVKNGAVETRFLWNVFAGFLDRSLGGSRHGNDVKLLGDEGVMPNSKPGSGFFDEVFAAASLMLLQRL